MTETPNQFYTLRTFAARTGRSQVGIRTRLVNAGRVPRGIDPEKGGAPRLWPVDVIEALIAEHPDLVQQSEPMRTIIRDAVRANRSRSAYLDDLQVIAVENGMHPLLCRDELRRMVAEGKATTEDEGSRVLVRLAGYAQ